MEFSIRAFLFQKNLKRNLATAQCRYNILHDDKIIQICNN